MTYRPLFLSCPQCGWTKIFRLDRHNTQKNERLKHCPICHCFELVFREASWSEQLDHRIALAIADKEN